MEFTKPPFCLSTEGWWECEEMVSQSYKNEKLLGGS